MAEVEVIQASDGPIVRDVRMVGMPLQVTRMRVAAYVRVSTDGEEQLQSFQSQKQYYQDKISQNKEWVMVGIYADEGITGTKTKKRDNFLKMIEDCMNGMIDVVMTKSVSRFSRNLVDTLQYVRMLKDRGVTIIFEKENINTSTMESEMQLALLATLAQNEVESLSQNVKIGVKMKMRRGEMMGFNGCLGYDYHQEDKSITVNEVEAETVRFIFDRYIEGYGAYTIAKELTALGKVNKKGEVKWTDSGVRGIIKNEKYKGDLLQGKTYTVDPISKRRLDNRGEEDRFYIKDHHEAIVSREVWDKAQEICQSRYKKNPNVVDGTRTKFTRKFAFSSMCECGFCGTNLTRRSHNQDTQHKKPVWKCRTASNKGIENCPQSKSIDEAIIENAFVEMFGLLAENFDDVLESVLASVEEAFSTDGSADKLKRIEKEIYTLENRRKKLTDLMLDDKITKEAYDEKYEDLCKKLAKAESEKLMFSENTTTQNSITKRMKEIRSQLSDANIMDHFDRFVFESIVEKIIVGETYDDGTVDPYKLTFVLKGMDNRNVPDAKNRYKNLHKQAG